MLDTYKPSGRLGAKSYALLAGGLVASAALGVAYEALLEVIPFVKLDIVICIGAAVGVAGFSKLVIQQGRCRNTLAAVLFGALIGLALWVTSFIAIWQYRVWNLAGHVPLRGYLEWRGKNGFTLGSGTSPSRIDGTALYLLWLAEGIMFIAFGAVAAAKQAKVPFCEKCDGWANSAKLNFMIEQPSAETVATIKKAQGVADLVPDPGTATNDGPPGSRLLYAVLGCLKCPSVDHVNIRHRSIVGSKKKPQERLVKLQSSVLIGPEELDALKAYAGPAAS